jgi:hypothetical protein
MRLRRKGLIQSIATFDMPTDVINSEVILLVICVMTDKVYFSLGNERHQKRLSKW